MSNDRYRPVRGPGGVVYSSSLGMQPRGSKSSFRPSGGPYRAVVVKTYVMGDPDAGIEATAGASLDIERHKVEADVILVKNGIRLEHVPVFQRMGIADGEPWVPKETTRTLSNNLPLNLDAPIDFRGTPQTPPTPLDDIDGDIVLVDFIEGDFQFPAVMGVYAHPRSHRKIVPGTGWDETALGSERGTPHAEERYVRFAGFEFRVNAQGDVLLDTVGSTSDTTEAEDPSEAGGHIRFRVKNTNRLTVEMDGTDVLEIWKDGEQVRIDLGEGATERLVLGDALMTFYNAFRTKYLAHTHPTGTGPSGTPVDTDIDQFTADLLSDLSRTKRT